MSRDIPGMSLAETVVFGAIMGGPATAGALCRTLLEMAAPSAFYTHKCIVKHIKMGLAVQDRSRDLYAGEILVENQAVPRPSETSTARRTATFMGVGPHPNRHSSRQNHAEIDAIIV